MGMIFKGLTFGGVNSLDYGIFITGEAVYNAPERSVTSIEIEGRNGDLLIDNGRFLNIEIKYPAGCFAETQEDFKQKIESFRNAIISQISYQRLTDDYNPDEYRLAVYKSGLDVSVAVLHQGGEFNLTFDCKPQRFLTSGETEKTIPDWSDIHTDSGHIVTIDNSGGEYAVKSLTTDIEPQQDLNGYDNPWVAGAGKNKLVHVYPSETKNGVTFTENANGTISTSGTATANAEHSLTWRVAGQYGTCFLKAGTYILSGCPSGGGSTKYEIGINTTIDGSGVTLARDYGNGATFTMQNDGYVGTWITIRNGQNASGLTFKPMIEQGSTATAYEPYENICPITGFDSANIYVSPTTSVGDATTYNISFDSAGTVYGGTLDVVSGQLTIDKVSETLTSESQLGSVSTSASYGPTDKFYCQYETKRVNNQALVMCDRALSISFDDRTSYVTNDRVYADTNTGSNLILRCSKDSTITTKTDFFNYWQGAQIVYTLATPLTYQLTATQVALLLGTNNVWSDTGDIQIEYGKGGNTLFNPTLFDSRPLIELTGAGTLGINNYIITITGSGKLYIDCDTMEAYTITGGIVTSANNRVSLNTTDYPVLRSGINSFAVGTGISNVKITPRWWRV